MICHKRGREVESCISIRFCDWKRCPFKKTIKEILKEEIEKPETLKAIRKLANE